MSKEKLNKYIKSAKDLINMPYNQLNLDNYIEKFRKDFALQIRIGQTKSNNPIKLMSGQHPEAQIAYSGVPYENKKRNIILIGKGILFDAGGYDLKSKMLGMKTDMAGMAVSFAVASYFKYIKGRKDIVAFCPVATNFIHNNQIIPGDYIKIGKKEVEITNTDAEGRLILAEALVEIDQRKNDIIITVATLTGSCAYAIGEKATAIITPNDKLANLYLKASKKAKELAWRLPLWDYLQKPFNKKRIENISKKKCGTIMGGMFIKQFVKYPENWIHLDIASSAYDDEKNKATGEPIKTLVYFIEGLLK